MSSWQFLSALGAWPTRPGPLYVRLADALRAAIDRGDLRPGDRLPPERSLAVQLSISRSSVVGAYDVLRGEGRIVSRQGSGTVVPTPTTQARDRNGRPIVVHSGPMSGLGEGGGAASASAGHRATDQAADDGGLPPTIELTVAAPPGLDVISPEVTAAAVADLEALARAHGYVPLGLPALRDAVAGHLTRAGLPTRRDEVLITNGAQQAISLTVALFVQPGDAVLIENPTWSGAMDALRAAGATMIPIPVDGDGARVDVVRDLARRLSPRLAYVCPTFQNPTGTLMPEQRRRELARIAEDADMPLLDDNALADLALGSAPPPPVATFARRSSGESSRAPILTIGSMSKIFWGGLRVGWIRGSESLIDRLARLKVITDHGGSLVSQALSIRLLEQIDEAKEIRRSHGLERAALVRSLLADALPEWRSSQPKGGHLLWVRLPRGDANELAQFALRHGVAVVGGSVASPDGTMKEWLRIPYVQDPSVLAEGVRRLVDAWRAYEASLAVREPVRIVV